MKLNLMYKSDLHQEELDVAWIDFTSDQGLDYILESDAQNDIVAIEAKLLSGFAVEF